MKKTNKLLMNLNQSKVLVGIIALVVIIIFSFAACPEGSTDTPNNNEEGETDSITSFSVQSKNIKSLYVSNLQVNNNRSARDIDASSAISTLSYTTALGQNAPILFTNSSGKTYILEITDMQQIDDKRIAALHNGYYEVTLSNGANGAQSYSISSKVDYYGSALIDMASGRVYDFTEYHGIDDDSSHADFGYKSGIKLIENDTAYVTWGWPESIIYKIDLTAASPQAIPLNSTYTPMNGIRPSFTINNKLLTSYWTEQGDYYYCVDISGTIPPKTVSWPQLPASIFQPAGYTKNEPVTMYIRWRYDGIPLKDLSGKVWFYSQYHPYADGVWWGSNAQGGKVYYLLSELSIDNEGQYQTNNVKTEELKFVPAADEQYDSGADSNFIYFYLNGAGTGVIVEVDGAWLDNNRRAFLHNGVIIINTNGYIKLVKRADEIAVESAPLTMPLLKPGRAVISKDGYLFWMDGKNIKRLELKEGAAETVIYTNSNIINPPLRDWIIPSGNKIIFYQYAEGSASTVYTYSLDMYANTPPELLATSDIDIKAVAELNF